MKRENGYYWVKWSVNSIWEVAEWNGVFWYETGNEYGYEENNFYAIHPERIKEPEK